MEYNKIKNTKTALTALEKTICRYCEACGYDSLGMHRNYRTKCASIKNIKVIKDLLESLEKENETK